MVDRSGDNNNIGIQTVVPVMNGHPRDQAKVSVHCRWPITWIITLDDVTYCSLVTRRQHGNLSELSIPSLGASQRFLVEMTTENVAFVCTVRYSRC